VIKNLFTTRVGAHVWQMDTEDSDIDLFRVFVVSTPDLLMGKANVHSEFVQKPGVDLSKHEISSVATQLAKGNINFVIGVLSPSVIKTGPAHQALKHVVSHNLSKNCYHSIRGMSEHNWKLHIKSGWVNEHECNKIGRVLQFGVTLLETGKVDFKPFSGGTMDSLKDLFEKLDKAYINSTLPEEPDKEALYAWVYGVRVWEWGLEKYMGFKQKMFL